METIKNLINVMLGLINAGCVLRLIMCFISLMGSGEGEVATYKKRIKNLISFMIIANCIWVITYLVLRYYGFTGTI